MTSAGPDISATPSRLGPYRITGTLGRGGMGVVYCGEDDEHRGRVAVKTVSVADETKLAGIRREIRALYRLRHPGVVRVVSEGVEASVPYYAMELLEGVTLDEVITSTWRGSRGTAETLGFESIQSMQPVRAPLAWSITPSAPPVRLSVTDVPAGTLPFGAVGVGNAALAHPPLAGTLPLGHLEEPMSSRDAAIHDPPYSGVRQTRAAQDLRDAIPKAELAVLLTLVRRLCDTLAYLHGEGIIHRDLKPANVFVRHDGTPALMDFGLVQRGAISREVLDVETLAGTPAYMAPEQLRGAFIDARADLYAVGVMLYEILTGTLPHQGGMVEKLTRLPDPPSFLVSGVPAELDRLVLRLLAPDPRHRVGHAADVSRALAELGADAWPVAIPEAAPYAYRPEIVGRDASLKELEAKIGDTAAGRGGFVLIRGESGIGKTYLALAAARRGMELGVSVITGSCLPVAASGRADVRINEAPFHPFASFFQVVADLCVTRGEAFTRDWFGDRAKILAACDPSLARLPGVEAIPDPPTLSAQAARERLRGALAATLQAVAKEKPLLLVLDDLQWADELTLELFQSLDPSFFRDQPLLVVATSRAEDPRPEIDAVCARVHAAIVEVGRLEEIAVTGMVSAMLAHERVPTAFSRFLADRSEGNPFFVVEYIRTALAERVLKRDDAGRWCLPEADAHERISVPVSLRELVAHRLAGLGPAARVIAAAGSVLGREFEVELCAGLVGLPEAEWLDGVQELFARQVVEETAPETLRFMHDKLREVAYEGIAADERRATQVAAGLAIESKYARHDRFPLLFAKLANHFREGGDTERAQKYLERAGDRALETFSNHEAAGHFNALLAHPIASSNGRDVDERVRRARWERKLTDAYYGTGDVNAMLDHATRALAWAGIHAPSTRGWWLRSLLASVPRQVLHRMFPGRFVAEDATERELFREASAAMQRLAQRSYFSDALAMIGGSLWAVNLAERAGGADTVALPYSMVGLTTGIARLSRTAARYFERARDAATKDGDDVGLIFTDYVEATWKSGDGDFAAARSLLERGLERAVRIGDRNQAAIARTILGNTAFFTGRFEASADALVAVIAAGERDDNRQHIAWGCYGAARALIPLGRWDEAAPLLERARDVLEPQVELPSKIICYALLARLEERRGDVGAALAAADLALAKIRENQLAAYAIAPAYEDVASVYLSAADGRGASADRARASAVAVLRELDKLALSLPMAAPYRLRAQGIAEARADRGSGSRGRRARKAFASAAERAATFGMAYEEARNRESLASVLPAGSLDRRAQEARADRLYADLGCPRAEAASA